MTECRGIYARPWLLVRAALSESTQHRYRVAAVAGLIGVPARRILDYLRTEETPPPWHWRGGPVGGRRG